MQRIVTVYGLISGVIVAICMGISGYLMLHDRSFPDYGMWIGYASMLLAFSFIAIAIKAQRDQSGGSISFGQAFMTGLWIALIASAFYTITWIIIYKNFYPTFLDDMFSRELAGMRSAGRSDAEILKSAEKMKGLKAMYATWPGLIGFTLLEILPVGLLVSLVCALIMKRKPAQPSQLARSVI